MSDFNLKNIADQIRARIDMHCQTYKDDERTHLGASLIGDECNRKLWFIFRWVSKDEYSGRELRIFDTGHKEEIRIIDWLKGAGYEIKNIDPNTGKQYVISGCKGHFGGSGDGFINIPEISWCLLECKSNKGGSEFKAFFDKGMEANKQKHWKQTCTYGYKFGIKYCVYVCKNKDNDDLYIEIVELNWELGKQMEEKAEDIIFSKRMPARISESPAYFECKYLCKKRDICFNQAEAENNCRSCKQAEPVENGEWKCNKWNSIIPKEEIRKAHECWESII